MATTLPARVQEYTAKQAKDSFTPAERKVFAGLQKYVTEHVRKDLDWYWELGVRLAAIMQTAKENHKLYGEELLLRMSKAMGLKSARQFYNALAVQKMCNGERAPFNEYCKLKGELGNILSWSHIVYLTQVPDDAKRYQMACAALAEGLSAAELWARVKGYCEDVKQRGIRTAQAKIPRSARGALTHMQAQAAKFVFNYDKAWTGQFNLLKTVQELPMDQISVKLVSDVQAAQTEVDKMKERAAQLATTLAAVDKELKERIARQQALEAAQSDDDDEDVAAQEADTLAALRKQESREQRERSDKRRRASAARRARTGRVGV
jgi:hypothetical protein